MNVEPDFRYLRVRAIEAAVHFSLDSGEIVPRTSHFVPPTSHFQKANHFSFPEFT